jgi:hypothetical protein
MLGVSIDTRESSSAAVLGSLLRVGEKVGNAMIDRAQEDAYLKGASQYNLEEANIELSGSVLTDDWARAGYRDTVGKLTIADEEAKLAAQMANLRTKPPEEFQKYLDKRRPKMLDSIQGMSAEQRQASLGKLIANDVAASKQHLAEHTKFIIDTKTQAAAAETNVRAQRLTAARMSGSIDAYKAELDAVVQTVQADVWQDKSIPLAVKQTWTKEFMESLLDSDNVAAFEALQTEPLPGEEDTLFSRLSAEDQFNLGPKYREARQRTQALRNTQWIDQKASYESQIDNDTFTASYSEARTFIDQMQQEGAATAESRGSFIKKVLDYYAKKGNSEALANAELTNNTSAVLSMGKGINDSLDALETQAKKNNEGPLVLVSKFLQAGMNGTPGAYARAGKWAAPSFMQLKRPDGTLDPQHKDMITAWNASIDQAMLNGQANTLVDFISGLPEEAQSRFTTIREFMAKGETSEGAIAKALEIEASTEKLSKQQRAAISSESRTDAAKFVQGIEPRSLIDTMWARLKSFVPWSDASAELKVTPRTYWFEDDKAAQEATVRTRMALLEEWESIGITDPLMSSDSKGSKALAAVANRTIPTEYSPLILPKGTNAQQVFGVPNNTHPDLIGGAISEVVKEVAGGSPEGTRHSFGFTQGKLNVYSYSADGMPLGSTYIDPKVINEKLQARYTKQRQRTNEEIGEGVTRLWNEKQRKAEDILPYLQRKEKPLGAAVNYNGNNSAGVEPSWALDFRNSLVQNEGIRNTTYTDTVGVETVGIGIAKHNPHYPTPGPDGKVTFAQISQSFMGASNDAISAASVVMRETGLENKAWFMLLSELSYQSGVNALRSDKPQFKPYKDMLEAGISGNKQAALEAFRQSPAYRVSGDERKQHYERLLMSALEN